MSKFEERDWTQLLPELIDLLTKKLPDILNFIRFRAVCKAWRSCSPLSDPPTQFPWLYEYPQVGYSDIDCYSDSDDDSDIDCDSNSDNDNARARSLLREVNQFYTISSSEILMIPVRCPMMSGTWGQCRGVFGHNICFNYHRESRDDIIPFDGRRTLHLYNPLTKKEFALEEIPLPLWKPHLTWTGTDSIFNRNILIVDDWYSTESEERAGLAFFDRHRKCLLFHKGSFSNAFLCQGMLLKTYEDGHTMFWDFSSKSFSQPIPPPDNEIETLNDKRRVAWPKRRTYIVESSGIILRVSWFYDRYRKNARKSIFHIYMLQFGVPCCWVKLDNIGNQILFLEKKTAFSMSARPSTGFKEGCIYFISPYFRKPYIYDILADTIERVPMPSHIKRCTWFVPGIC